MTADEVLGKLAPTLTAGPYPIEEVFRLGAVCNGPRHLVVFVRLENIRTAFKERDWPAAFRIPVEFQC